MSRCNFWMEMHGNLQSVGGYGALVGWAVWRKYVEGTEIVRVAMRRRLRLLVLGRVAGEVPSVVAQGKGNTGFLGAHFPTHRLCEVLKFLFCT